jgi:hypothetical protein
MRFAHKVCAVIAVVGVCGSDVRADCALVPFPEPHYPFVGARIPVGTTMRFPNLFQGQRFDVEGPGGPIAFEFDDISFFFHTDGLALGRYASTNTSDVFFDLVEADAERLSTRLDDSEAPPPPEVSAVRQTVPGSVSLPFFDDCGSRGPYDVISANVRSAEPFGLILVDGVAVSGGADISNAIVELPALNVETELALSVLDLAGNHSDDTIVVVDGGCGCDNTGAASGTATSCVALALAFFARRRVRRGVRRR